MKTNQPFHCFPLPRKFIVLPLIAMALLAGNNLLAQDPTIVGIPGTFQSELGCPGDWQPDCSNTFLTFEGTDDVWQGIFTIPAGYWEYKAALDGTWDWNFGLNATQNGPNIPLSLADVTEVKFYYDHKTHWITDNVNSEIAVAVGNFQSELGGGLDWDPALLRSWLEDPDGDGIFTFLTNMIPAGNYEAKVAHNESWDENYGAGGVPDGPNIPFTVAGPAFMLFSYDLATHILTVEEITPPPPTGTIVINKLTFPDPYPGVDFSFKSNHFLTIHTPGSIAGDYPAGGAYFGPQVDFNGITGDLVLVNDGIEPETNGCEPLVEPVSGNIALIDRGWCYFVDKVLNAQAAGAIGVVIVNNIPGAGALEMGGDAPGIAIPAISISYEDGAMIKEQLESGPVNATMRSELAGNFYLQHGQSKVITDVPAGIYSITESNPAGLGFNLAFIQIEDPDNQSIADLQNQTAIVNLAAGETVECTFYNVPCPAVAVYPQSLEFFVPYNGSAEGSFTIDNYGDPGGVPFAYSIPGPFEDFEGYVPGQQLACQNPAEWTTWSMMPCGQEDAWLSTNYAYSGSNSVLIDYTTNSASVDLVKLLGAKTSGQWQTNFSMYLPFGKTGYFNHLSGFTPDPFVWAFECFFDGVGNGYLFAGGPDPVIFAVPSDSWNMVQIIVDLDGDVGQFLFNGNPIHNWQWTLAYDGSGGPLRLAASNFFAFTDYNEMYIDDFSFSSYPECPLQLTFTPDMGVIPDGSAQEVLVSVDASGLLSGTYQCELNIEGFTCSGLLPVTVIVHVEDNEPPVINLADPLVFWPPNHKYENVDLSEMIVSIVDNVDGNIPVEMAIIEEASSDEPDDAPGNGDGKTINDIVIASGCKSVDLRNERQGGGNGRVYRVILSASDAAGNTAMTAFEVSVPHDQNSPAIDDGPAFTVYCNPGYGLSILNPGTAVPKDAGLLNIPNPFTTSTVISFTMPDTEAVQLKVYNSLGDEVASLYHGIAEAGLTQEILFKAEGLPKGVYYCRLQSASGVYDLRKMILIR